MEHDLKISYYVGMYKRFWKQVTTSLAAALCATVLFSMIAPVKYVSTVGILLTNQGNPTISSLSRMFSVSSADNGSAMRDIIISVLKSRRMVRDINQHFALKSRRETRWSINIKDIVGGLQIEVRGYDPDSTEKIANYCVQNLDNINNELDITTVKPMVKVLDPASYGEPASREIPRKLIIAVLLVLLVSGLLIFYKDQRGRLGK